MTELEGGSAPLTLALQVSSPGHVPWGSGSEAPAESVGQVPEAQGRKLGRGLLWGLISRLVGHSIRSWVVPPF